MTLIMKKQEFEEPEIVDKKLAELIINDVPKKVYENLKKKNLKI